MLITELAKSRSEQLTPTDRRLIATLQSQPAEASYWLASDLTAPLGLHQSAATRLAQRLGFDGYPQLRDALRDDYLAGEGPSQRLRGRLERQGEDDVLNAFVADEIAALEGLPRHVAQAEIDTLADRILAAGEIFLFGHGNSTVLADLLARRLERFGLRTVRLTGSRRDIAEHIARMSGGDLLIAYSFRRVHGVLPPLLEAAEEVGTYTALVTDTVMWPSPRPRTILAAPRGGGDEFLSLTVPMALTNALVLTLARRAEPGTLRSLDRLGHLIELLDA